MNTVNVRLQCIFKFTQLLIVHFGNPCYNELTNRKGKQMHKLCTCERKMKNTPSFALQILTHIENSPNGLTFGEIQRFSFALSHPGIPFFIPRIHRGHNCLNLLGNILYRRRHGLLTAFCEKGTDGQWRRNNTPHNGKPYGTASKMGRPYPSK